MTAIKTASQNIDAWSSGTKPHYMHLTDKKSGEDSDISGWRELKMYVFSRAGTEDDNAAVAILDGSLTTDGTDGRLQFAREAIPPGNYYYRCRAVDSSDGAVFTFCAGRYKIEA